MVGNLARNNSGPTPECTSAKAAPPKNSESDGMLSSWTGPYRGRLLGRGHIRRLDSFNRKGTRASEHLSDDDPRRLPSDGPGGWSSARRMRADRHPQRPDQSTSPSKLVRTADTQEVNRWPQAIELPPKTPRIPDWASRGNGSMPRSSRRSGS